MASVCDSRAAIPCPPTNATEKGSVIKIIFATCGPGSKGSAADIAKGYVGLGAAMYGGLFESLVQTNQSDLDFIPMAAFFAIVSCCNTSSLALHT